MPKKKTTDTTIEQAHAVPKKSITVPEDGIGERIKEARQRPGNDLNLEALSRLCREYDRQGQGITPTTLLRYEQGKVKPGARELRILCESLDVSADWLLLGEENRKTVSMGEMLEALEGVVSDRLASKKGRLFGEAAASDRQKKLSRAKAPQKP